MATAMEAARVYDTDVSAAIATEGQAAKAAAVKRLTKANPSANHVPAVAAPRNQTPTHVDNALVPGQEKQFSVTN
jgi:hypothetical protein